MHWGPGTMDLLEHQQRFGAAAAIPVFHISRECRLQARKWLQVFTVTVNIWFWVLPVKRPEKSNRNTRREEKRARRVHVCSSRMRFSKLGLIFEARD